MMKAPRKQTQSHDHQRKHHQTRTSQPGANTSERQTQGDERRCAADRGEDRADHAGTGEGGGMSRLDIATGVLIAFFTPFLALMIGIPQ